MNANSSSDDHWQSSDSDLQVDNTISSDDEVAESARPTSPPPPALFSSDTHGVGLGNSIGFEMINGEADVAQDEALGSGTAPFPGFASEMTNDSSPTDQVDRPVQKPTASAPFKADLKITPATAAAQLAAVRREQKRRYNLHLKREAESAAKQPVDLTASDDEDEQPIVSGSGSGQDRNAKGKGKRIRGGSSDEEGATGTRGTAVRKSKISKTKHDPTANAEAGPSGKFVRNAPTTSIPGPPPPKIKYPQPRIFLTRTAGRMRPPLIRNTVTLGQILDKTTMLSCFLFSFFIGQDELFSYLPLAKSGPHSVRAADIYIGRDLNMEFYLAETMQALGIHRPNMDSRKPFTHTQFDMLRARLASKYEKEYGKNFKAVYTNMAGKSGCVHSKFGVIVYGEFLRVFITSGNLMALDAIHSDNHWFVVDLPELETRRPAGSFPPEFEQELLKHASLLGCPKEFINRIYGRYDYSALSSCHLIASVPGNHSGDKAMQYGALRLRECIRKYMKTRSDPYIEICTGSIGGMQESWLRGMYHAFSGAMYDDKGQVGVPPFFKIFFPTRPDVEAVRAISKQGSSQIGAHLKFSDASPAIQQLFHHYKSKDQAPGNDDADREVEEGQGCLFHQKLYMCFKDSKKSSDPPLWLCIGSHNFSKAAWGDIKDDLRKKQGPRIKRLSNISNFELSVAMPGSILTTALEPGSDWQEVVPHQRDTQGYMGKDKPFNSSAWVQDGNGGDLFGGAFF